MLRDRRPGSHATIEDYTETISILEEMRRRLRYGVGAPEAPDMNKPRIEALSISIAACATMRATLIALELSGDKPLVNHVYEESPELSNDNKETTR